MLSDRRETLPVSALVPPKIISQSLCSIPQSGKQAEDDKLPTERASASVSARFSFAL